MIIAFEFKNNKPSNFFICHSGDNAAFTNQPDRPLRHMPRDCSFPLFTHVFEITKEELNRVWSNKNDYTLEQMKAEFNLLAILECDWKNGCVVDLDGFIDGNYAVFNDEKPPSYVVMTEPPNNLKKPKWTGVEWVEGYIEEIKEPTELELLQRENKQLKTEIEQHKSEANVTTQAIFELALEIESLKGGA